jgi:hypothetical protein
MQLTIENNISEYANFLAKNAQNELQFFECSKFSWDPYLKGLIHHCVVVSRVSGI